MASITPNNCRKRQMCLIRAFADLSDIPECNPTCPPEQLEKLLEDPDYSEGLKRRLEPYKDKEFVDQLLKLIELEKSQRCDEELVERLEKRLNEETSTLYETCLATLESVRGNPFDNSSEEDLDAVKEIIVPISNIVVKRSE